jgi:N6-adenosine-specific RNA methylase IME4
MKSKECLQRDKMKCSVRHLLTYTEVFKKQRKLQRKHGTPIPYQDTLEKINILYLSVAELFPLITWIWLWLTSLNMNSSADSKKGKQLNMS